MTKQELATTLATALNLLNELQVDLDPKQQGAIHDLFATLPSKILEAVDFHNNGSLEASDLLKA